MLLLAIVVIILERKPKINKEYSCTYNMML